MLSGQDSVLITLWGFQRYGKLRRLVGVGKLILPVSGTSTTYPWLYLRLGVLTFPLWWPSMSPARRVPGSKQLNRIYSIRR